MPYQDKTGMDEQAEKVRKGLECCLPETQEQAELSCAACPYDPCGVSVSLPIRLIDDVRKLITAQQERIKALEAERIARVMTLEEADNAEVAWLEEYADPADGVEPIIQPVIIVWHENGCWHCLIDRNEDTWLDLFIDGLWTEWRFWTQRPTDEQRKAVKLG